MKNRPLPIPRRLVERGSIACSLLLLLLATVPAAADDKTLTGHVPDAISKLNLQPVGRLPATSRLDLAIGLPLHNRGALSSLVNQMYDPTSGYYHHFLTPEQIKQHYGPTEQEYQAVIQFAEANGLEVVNKFDNHLVLNVSGKVSDIENAFHVTLRTYQHPTEARQFYAPDVEPTVDASLSIVNISGLNNYALSHPNSHQAKDGASGASSGSGLSGSLRGYDFRNAYAPGVGLTGSGQIVGLFEMEGYYLQDITNYEVQAGISPHVPVQNVLLGLSGAGSSDAECALDIEMAISMAPGLSKVVVFEGTNWDTILNSMVSYSEIKQFSCSWGFSGGTDATMENDFLIMGAQGQSFFLASGDGDAFPGALMGPDDCTNITTVGGTFLNMNGLGVSYASESVWNWGQCASCGNYWYTGTDWWGSGGGISTRDAIPTYQQGISMASNQGSTVWRNVPDVACVASGIYVIFGNGLYVTTEGGTSCAAPLWAGFTALVNQQAAEYGQPSVGFLNPALYAIAKGPSYTSCFNDITSGNNYWASSPSHYSAVAGYDLCTGLGTPAGQNLINALMPFSGATWVDYNYTGATQNGSYDNPYKTLAQGVTAVSASGNIWFKTSGHKLETMTITKPMTINAANGPATVGQ